MPTYAADGSMNVTVVGGVNYTGLYAADGSMNVVQTVGTGNDGYYSPRGAANVTLYTTGPVSRKAKSGSLYVSKTPYVQGTQRVTVVSGTLT